MNVKDSKQVGQVLMEFILVVPFLITFILGSMHLAFYVSSRQVLVHATQTAALASANTGNVNFGAVLLYRESSVLPEFDQALVSVETKSYGSAKVTPGMNNQQPIPRGDVVKYQVTYRVPTVLGYLDSLGLIYVESEALVVCRVPSVGIGLCKQ